MTFRWLDFNRDAEAAVNFSTGIGLSDRWSNAAVHSVERLPERQGKWRADDAFPLFAGRSSMDGQSWPKRADSSHNFRA